MFACKKSKGYLLIEIILAISIFALISGAVLQSFLLGLRLLKESSGTPNEAIFSETLINKIQLSDLSAGATPIELPVEYPNAANKNQKWKLEIKSSNKISPLIGSASVAGAAPNLYLLKIDIAQIEKDGAPIASTSQASKQYEIFRYIKN